MSQIEIIDNYLPQDIFNTLQELLLSKGFPWFFNDYIVDHTPTNYQFVHVFKPNSQYIQLVRPLLNKINPTQVLRCKLNLRPITQQHEQSPYHIDQTKYPKYKIAIYYINTNNGYTIFEHNKQQVESIANRILIFDGQLKHAGVSSTDTKRRVVLNLNYMEQLWKS
mgnify:CR=1 FL=1